MSTDIGAGKRSRKILTIIAVAFAVVLMLAAPLITAVDTDAAFTPDEAGFLISSENPTDAEISTYSGETRGKIYIKDNSTQVFLKIFNVGPSSIFGEPTVTQEKLTTKYGEGWQIESDTVRDKTVEEMTAENVTMVFTATENGELIPDSYEYIINYKDAADAIREFLGNSVSEGDTLTVKGSLKSRYATQSIIHYAAVDDTKSVVKSQNDSLYYVYGVDVTIELKSGSNAAKTISFHSDKKYLLERDFNVDYKGKAYSDLQPGDMCRYVNDIDRYLFESGSSYFTVDGKNYGIEHTAFPPEYGDEPVVIITDSTMNLDTEKAFIALIPASAGNVTVDKTYEALDKEVSEVASDVALDDILKFVLIGAGVIIGIFVIVILIVVLLIVRKKKRQ